MIPVVVAVVLVLLLAVVGLTLATKGANAEMEREEAALRRAVAELFPKAEFTLWPFSRGALGARLVGVSYIFELEGCYLEAEGGDGYLHIHRVDAGTRSEVGRVSLRSEASHYRLLLRGIEMAAKKLQEESGSTRPQP